MADVLSNLHASLLEGVSVCDKYKMEEPNYKFIYLFFASV